MFGPAFRSKRQPIARLAIAAGVLVLASACGAFGLGTPTPSEILAKPAKSDLKDAHYTLTAHYTSVGTGVDVKGDGLMVLKPKSALTMNFTGSVGTITVALQLISVDGQYYQRIGSAKWTKSTTTGNLPSMASSWAQATDAKLVGEEDLGQGKAWHVKATLGMPLEVWVRESDGYPLKLVSGAAGTNNFTFLFDHFNTGQKVTAPAASDMKPEPKNVVGTVGQPMHLASVDVTVVSVDQNAKAASKYSVPKAGNRFVAVQILYESTSTDAYRFSDFDWRLVDSAGFSYDQRFSGVAPELSSGTLTALGDKARGWITYEVPTSSTGLALKLKSGEDLATVQLG
jgi:hypothetical protein